MNRRQLLFLASSKKMITYNNNLKIIGLASIHGIKRDVSVISSSA